jgi:hypothetical protein
MTPENVTSKKDAERVIDEAVKNSSTNPIIIKATLTRIARDIRELKKSPPVHELLRILVRIGRVLKIISKRVATHAAISAVWLASIEIAFSGLESTILGFVELLKLHPYGSVKIIAGMVSLIAASVVASMSTHAARYQINENTEALSRFIAAHGGKKNGQKKKKTTQRKTN